MGEPKKHRKKYARPMHPWQKTRIDEEMEIKRNYGVKNKKEIWKMQAIIKKFSEEVKGLITKKEEVRQEEKNKLVEKAKRMGLIAAAGDVDEILGLKLKDVMERRLQSLVLKKQLANTIKQARQFITHEHITVDGVKITSPSYLVPAALEDKIAFTHNSPFVNTEHPERVKLQEKEKKPKAEEIKKEEPKKPAKKKEILAEEEEGAEEIEEVLEKRDEGIEKEAVEVAAPAVEEK